MKKYIILALIATLPVCLIAQQKQIRQQNEADTTGIIFKRVPPDFNIKDRIIIRNRSPYTIIQVVVAQVVEGKLKPLGSTTNVKPNKSEDIGWFKNNSLKHLRGRDIAIKAKALKKQLSDMTRTDVSTPLGDVTVTHEETSSESANSARREDFTYDFEATLFEDRHDLFIDLYSKNDKSIMNF